MEHEVYGTLENIEIGATGLTEILQNVKVICCTMRGSVPLDRGFGIAVENIDAPIPVAKAKLVSAIVAEVEKQEPRVKVTAVDFIQSDEDLLDGKMIPRVRIRIKDGVELS